jgi:menaquinone-dependent protoporphyrinogen oxidase
MVDGPILVAYATRFGSSREIAQAIVEEMREHGCTAEALCVQDVSTLDGYAGVVVGGPVNRGQWLPEAIRFVEQRAEALRKVPVALFCVHISHPAPQVRDSYIGGVRAMLHPVSEAFFAGRFDRRGAALLIPKALAWLVPPIDLRNWDAIRKWARSLVPLLQGRAA